MSDWRIVNSTGHAERFTTAVGEAFFVQNERKILMVIEYTAHADDEVRYKAVPYYAPGVRKATAVFWGIGQTEAWPVGFPNEQTGILLRRMAFAADGPHEDWDGGGDGLFDDFFVAAADVDSNIDAGSPAAATDNVVFSPPPGRYTIKAWWASDDPGGDQAQGLGLYRITAGNDDAVLAFPVGFKPDVTDAATTETVTQGTMLERTVVIASGDQLYLSAYGTDAGHFTRHYMEITKVQ